ncbi:unannotated protein [freshwater metagenome]|uniref:Unannotated protein n=1 Tax=freshwater metagenome TaxID=449393 RepID=A0A6J6X0Q9_9ZZZZ
MVTNDHIEIWLPRAVTEYWRGKTPLQREPHLLCSTGRTEPHEVYASRHSPMATSNVADWPLMQFSTNVPVESSGAVPGP